MLINIFGQRAVLRYLNLEHCCSLQRQFFLNKPRLHTGTCADNAAKLDNSYCQKHEQLPIKIKNHGTLKNSLVLELEHPAFPSNIGPKYDWLLHVRAVNLLKSFIETVITAY